MFILILGGNMKSKLQKWGNSQGVRIPNSFLKQLGLKENDNIDISTSEDCIIIRKDNYKSFDEIVDGYNGDYVCEEFEPYDVRGNELW